MHPQADILLKAMAAACVTFFVVKISALLPTLVLAFGSN